MARGATDCKIVPYHSTTTGNIPAAADMAIGEIAVNLTDKKIFTKDGGENVVQLGISLSDVYPVGSVYTSVVSTSPATLFGFGTWSQIAQGKMLVGQNPSDTDFDTAEETGGSKTANLEHNHSISLNHSGTAVGNHDVLSHTVLKIVAQTTTGIQNAVNGINNHTLSAHSVTQPDAHSGNTGNGGSTTQNIMNPYFVVYMWKRTA